MAGAGVFTTSSFAARTVDTGRLGAPARAHGELPRLGAKRLSRITTRDVENWIMDLHENTKLALATINQCLNA